MNRRNASQTDVLIAPSLRSVTWPLLLSPIAGAAVVVAFLRAGRDTVEAFIIVLPFSYAAMIVFVLPVMIVWPRARNPGYPISILWGSLAAFGVLAFLEPRLFFWSSWRGWGALCLAGAVAGTAYVALVRRRAAAAPSSHQRSDSSGS